MKKSKMLSPILAITTLSCMAAPSTVLANCSCGNTAEISLDSSTTAEQTTSDNKTVTTYCFNLKNKLKQSTNDENEEIEVEIEDEQTSDNITIEISALQYDSETGKFYVTITISKEEGTLNDGETITFSLNFHCKSADKKEKWSKKLTKFIIKHSGSQLLTEHLIDTDVTKKIKKDENVQKGTQLTEQIKFPVNPSETWKESSASTEEYDLSKLKCFVLSDQNIRIFKNTITFPEATIEGLNKTLTTVAEEDNKQYITVEVPYKISQQAHFGDKVKFTLLFTYPQEGAEQAVFQSIGGFSISYEETLEEVHATLINSKEQHYYSPATGDKETGMNVLGFILDNKTTYSIDDFTIESSNNKIIFGEEKQILNTSVGTQLLIISYTINQNIAAENHDQTGDNLFNVSITLKSDNQSEGASWTTTIKGLSFYKGSSRFEEGTIISYDAEALSKVTYTAKANIDFTDVLRTCKPFNIKNFVPMYSWATIDNVGVDFDIQQLGWKKASEHYSVATLKANEIESGEHTITIHVCIVSGNVSYFYTLNVGKVTFA